MNNNTLVGGLFIALIIVIGGTWISLNYINDLTGAATSIVGSVNVSVTSATSCVMLDNLVSFGAMARGQYNESDTIKTGGDYMALENDGNTNITVAAQVTTNLWAAQPAGAGSPYWAIKCNNVTDRNSTCTNTWQNLKDTTTINIITGFTPVNDLDNMSIAFNLTVPSDEPSGIKNGTVTFTCSQT